MIIKTVNIDKGIHFVDNVENFVYNREEGNRIKCEYDKRGGDRMHQLETTDEVYLLNDSGKTIERLN